MYITRYCVCRTTYKYSTDFDANDLDSINTNIHEYYETSDGTPIPTITFDMVAAAANNAIHCEEIYPELGAYIVRKGGVMPFYTMTIADYLADHVDNMLYGCGGDPIDDEWLDEDTIVTEDCEEEE